ncbi:hypothetical protein H310_09893 [Aphanomyces invadans]|uniref:Uncharacterized protein n=1 Tax=Aphanomyces invadans TaxID=157072 RepID=A0A024TTV7_9STRA|nr:hypothetical protein H310_09893 [Aphanomyces invadans]ETV97071.1 hypothetical protein H310_09893 [Aphanomyces invadans]|eukprot:XP_008874317.1 hypothetical protein H310_09893 [Aphanomyces invadans]
MKAPTFEKMIQRVIVIVEPILYEQYVMPVNMTRQVQEGKVFANFPSALYSKHYFSGKHKLDGLKLEISF